MKKIILLIVFPLLISLLLGCTRIEKKLNNFVIKQKFEEAETYCKSQKKEVECYKILAKCCLEKGFIENANKYYEEINDKEGLKNVADAFFIKKDYLSAYKCYEKSENNEGLKKTSNYLLLIASEKGDATLLQLLLNKGIDVNFKDENGFTALMKAVEGDHNNIIKLLLENGADINIISNNGWNALMIAVCRGFPAIVKDLLEKGADINASYNGTTVLMLAVSGFNKASWSGIASEEMIKILLDNGANLNKKMNDGRTALMIAAQNNDPTTVKYFLEKGAKINDKDNLGRTAIIFVTKQKKFDQTLGQKIVNNVLFISKRRLDTVKVLIEKGIDINVADNNGKTALMYAKENNHEEIIKYLKKVGVKR